MILGILTVLFIVAWAGGITFLMASCEQESLCSDEVTSLVELASLALLAVIVFPLNRALGRAMGIGKSDDSVSAKAPAITSELNRQIQGRAVLSFGQSRIAGNVQSVDVGRHSFTVDGMRLRCWGGYALRSDWIKRDSWAVFVYQRFLGLNYVLAFGNDETTAIRGVGGAIHAIFLALAAVGLGMVVLRGTDHQIWLPPIYAMLFLESGTYLLLQFYAKRGLRNFIDNATSN